MVTSSNTHRTIFVIGVVILASYVFVTTGNPVGNAPLRIDAIDTRKVQAFVDISNSKNVEILKDKVKKGNKIDDRAADQGKVSDSRPEKRQPDKSANSNKVKQKNANAQEESKMVKNDDSAKLNDQDDDLGVKIIMRNERDVENEVVDDTAKRKENANQGEKQIKKTDTHLKDKDGKVGDTGTNSVVFKGKDEQPGNVPRKMNQKKTLMMQQNSGKSADNFYENRLRNSAQEKQPLLLKAKTKARRIFSERLKKKFIGNKEPVKLNRKPKVEKPKKIFRKVKQVKQQNLTPEEKAMYENKLIATFGAKYKTSLDYQWIVDKCSEYKDRKGAILFLDTSKYIETQPHLCDGEQDILLAVHTRPNNFERRQLIRNTFGSMRYIRGKRLVLAFFLGTMGDQEVMKQVRNESQRFGDIIQRDYVEHYRNMTYKHLTVMNWMMEYCPRVNYLVKIDDDVFVNIFQVVDYIETFHPQSLYCTRTVGPKPQRKKGKWKLTFQEYSHSRFPPYCMGYAYLMKASLARDIYWCSVYSKFLWIDDVLVGGVLPQKLGIELVRFITGHNSAYLLPSHGSWKIADHMFLLGTRNELLPGDIRKIWRSSLQYSY